MESLDTSLAPSACPQGIAGGGEGSSPYPKDEIPYSPFPSNGIGSCLTSEQTFIVIT